MTDKNQRTQAALYSIFIGDALSMPVHWYYRVSDIIRTFPPHGIAGMEAAPREHPSSIMSLHSTQAGGRKKSNPFAGFGKAKDSDQSPFEGEIVGDVILKGKRALWGENRNHYHHGMAAGDNTLNACCARLMLRHLAHHGGYSKKHWLEEYIAFMTAEPEKHPDTYAESYHRGFFANLQKGLPVDQCGAVTHDTPSMGALVTVGPLALALLCSNSLEKTQKSCCEHVQLTHPDANLMKVVCEYVALIQRLLMRGESALVDVGDTPDHDALTDTFIKAATVIPGAKLEQYFARPTGDGEVVGRVFSTACYITDSWPSVCYLAAKYHASPSKALLANTNLGGENAHRGSVLGSLVGLAGGNYDDGLFSQLLHRDAIENEVRDFMDAFH